MKMPNNLKRLHELQKKLGEGGEEEEGGEESEETSDEDESED